MNIIQKIELLSPARNLECGLAAIAHGADAVYIGGPAFGAREAVGNPVRDIEKLAEEAHLFGAKVYVAFNTILYDEELEKAQKLINEVYNAGADALIIQDMGILEMDLPPLPLHSSTQSHNYAVPKIEFLEKTGFKRAVLARELSLDQIKEIRTRTSIELEFFIHGSLCVSLSGQCYLSHAMGGRSANRGVCAQPCRKQYSLTDAEGRILLDHKYPLSLKDLDLSDSLIDLMEAGICSFKIEGRLKDIDYVKNITSFYRKKFDSILEEKIHYQRASIGKTYLDFEPDPKKTFNRGSTDYFLHGRTKNIVSINTPKSLGEEIGNVKLVTKEFFEIESAVPLFNNDGLTFVSRNGENSGIKVNKTDGKRIYPDKMNGLYRGAFIYRNYDHQFRKRLNSAQSIKKIRIEISLNETSGGFVIALKDEAGIVISKEYIMDKQLSKDISKSAENIKKQLSKTGDTPFEVSGIEVNGSEKYFFQTSLLNLMRREILENLTFIRKQKPHFIKKTFPNSSPFPLEELRFQTNVSNHLAKRFYERHGIPEPGTAFEKIVNHQGLTVMTTKNCLKYQLGYCRKYDKSSAVSLNEPLYLISDKDKLRLEFDCTNCFMKVLMD